MIHAARTLIMISLTARAGGGLGSLPPAAREIEVVGRNYAFTAPREARAGRVSFRFTNEGSVDHELAVDLLKPGVSEKQIMAALNAKQPLKPMIEASVGLLLATPGHRSSVALSTDLLPNRIYLVICRLQDSASTPTHSRMGMFSVIRVTPAAAASAPLVPPVDTIVGSDYAFRAPPSLTPGSHTLAFVNAGTVNHEVNIMLLRRGVSVGQLFDVAKRDGDLHPLVEEFMGVLATKGGSSPLGSFLVTLLPGREYVLMCQFANDEKSPSHITLGMFASIRVPRARGR